MTTHFVTLIQSAERGTLAAGPKAFRGRFGARAGLRGLVSRWARPVLSHEQRLAA